jgi:nucleotide-binding universal stress UspA family protein
MNLKTVLCPVDFTALVPRELQLAIEVCRAFGSRLVLHHNVAEIGPGLSRAWDWDSTHRRDEASFPDAERRMKAMLASVGDGIEAEAVVTRGPLAAVVLALAEQLPVDLIILASHGRSTDEHASVTERVVQDAPCPILTLEEHGGSSPAPFRLAAAPGEAPARVLVPADLSADGAAALAYACDLAQRLALHLDVLHVVSNAAQAVDARSRVEALLPEPVRARAEVHVRTGNPADEIVAHVGETRPAFAVVGGHARSLLRRFLTRDTAREVVHRAHCPVWVVPARRAAGARA